LIGHYLLYAIRFAKSHHGASNIALFSEVFLQHPNLPGLGPISGNLDFVTAHVDLGNLSLREFGPMAGPEKPSLLVVETKREATLPEHSSQAQLFAQLISLDYEDHMAMYLSQK
jgi:hypothetical protein